MSVGQLLPGILSNCQAVWASTTWYLLLPSRYLVGRKYLPDIIRVDQTIHPSLSALPVF